MAVNGVDPVYQGDLQAGFQGPGLEFVAGLCPVCGIVGRIGIAAAKHGADKILLDVGLVLNRVKIDLCHLPDFFIERHRLQQGIHLGIDGRVIRSRRSPCRG